MLMPTRGKCQVCGECKMLYGPIALEKTDGSGLMYVMCCRRCKEYFEDRRREKK